MYKEPSVPSVPSVLMNDFKSRWREIEPRVLKAIQRVGASGWYILGPEVREFESKLAKLSGQRFAIGCANGMDALEIGLRCAGVKSGDEVLTTPLSAFATTLAILRIGAKPVFVDVDQSGQIDLDLVSEFLRTRPSVRYFLPVHLYGHALDLDRLEQIVHQTGITVIEDCAQAILAKSSGRLVGSVGLCSGTSFYPTKNLGALGDGGALLTNSPDIDKSARCSRDYGQSAKYVHSTYGMNSRLDELHAAVLSDVMLPDLDSRTKRRQDIAGRFLSSISNPALKILPVPNKSESVWHLFPLIAPPAIRQNFVNHLKSAGVECGIHYPFIIPDQPMMATHGILEENKKGASGFAVARRIANSEVSIPIHPELEDDHIEKVIETCNSWNP